MIKKSISNLKQTFINVKKHYFLLLISSALEVLFFYVLTRLHVEIFRAAATHIKEAQKIIQSQVDKLAQTQYGGLDNMLMGNADFAMQYHEIIKYIGIFLIGVAALWFVLRALNWFIAHTIAGTKIIVKEFLKRFVMFSILGFAALILILLAYTKMLSYAAFNPLPLINAKTAHVLFGIMLITLHYLLSTAFSLPKNSRFSDIKKIITRAKKIVPAFALSNLVLILLFIIPALLGRNHKWLGLCIGLFATIPMITIARIYLINALKNK